MPEGLKVRYKADFLRISGYEADRPFTAPAVAVFVPGEKLFVKPRYSPGGNGLHSDVSIFVGESAQPEYESLLASIEEQNVVPEKIEVGQAFIDWANIVHQALRTPPKEISELLDPY